MSKFDYKKLGELQAALKKQAFVPMDPSMAAGGGGEPMPPDGGAGAPPPPMDPSMMGGGGMPPDPSMMGGGGMPPDPSMMGGAPMPPMDPSMMGAPADSAGLPPPPGGEGEVSPEGEPYMKFTPSQLTKFIKQILAISHSECGSAPVQQAPAPQPAPQDNSNQKVEEMIAKLDAVLGGAGVA